MRWWLIAALVLGAGCDGEKDVSTDEVDTDTDTDTDTDSDADTDSDSDSDTDTDADTDTDTDTDVVLPECETPVSTPSPTNVCITDTISCGETVYGTNAGGSTHYGTNVGEQFQQCSGSASGNDFDGPERVYALQVPDGVTAFRVFLESCEESWLFWHAGESCPTGMLNACNYATNGTFFDQWDEGLIGQAPTMYFVIEGNNNDGGNYAFTLECF